MKKISAIRIRKVGFGLRLFFGFSFFVIIASALFLAKSPASADNVEPFIQADTFPSIPFTTNAWVNEVFGAAILHSIDLNGNPTAIAIKKTDPGFSLLERGDKVTVEINNIGNYLEGTFKSKGWSSNSEMGYRSQSTKQPDFFERNQGKTVTVTAIFYEQNPGGDYMLSFPDENGIEQGMRVYPGPGQNFPSFLADEKITFELIIGVGTSSKFPSQNIDNIKKANKNATLGVVAAGTTSPGGSGGGTDPSFTSKLFPQCNAHPSVSLSCWSKEVFKFASVAVGIAAIVMISVGGVLYITSGGDPGRTGTAKKLMFNALMGVTVLVLANWFFRAVLGIWVWNLQ